MKINTMTKVSHYVEIEKQMQSWQKMMDNGNNKQTLQDINDYLAAKMIRSADLWRAYDYLAKCYYNMGALDKWREFAWKSLMYTEGQPLIWQQIHYSEYLFLLHNFSDVSREQWRILNFQYDIFSRQYQKYRHECNNHNHTKIRIGYFASKFSTNVLCNFICQFFTDYDADKFELYCYSILPDDDVFTDFLRKHVKKVSLHTTKDDVREIAREIYNDEIDILFDMDVHNAGGRTLLVEVYKPAPVIIAGLGYIDTSGMKDVDYYLTDSFCSPKGLNENDFSEILLRMDDSHFCFSPMNAKAFMQSDHCRHEGVIFASFNNYRKLTNEIFIIWKKILDAVPDSKLLIKNSARRFDNKEIRTRIEDMIQKNGIARERIVLESPSNDYLSRYDEVDIILDTYPYVGGTTTCEALLKGVPVITRYGEKHGTRFGLSLLANLGLQELASSDWETYIEKSIAIARDKELRQALRTQIPILMRKSPLMNQKKYMENIESLYQKIWQKWWSNNSK